MKQKDRSGERELEEKRGEAKEEQRRECGWKIQPCFLGGRPVPERRSERRKTRRKTQMGATQGGDEGTGSAGRRDGSGAGTRLLGLIGACGRAHRGGRGPAPLAVEVWGGVWRERRLSWLLAPPCSPWLLLLLLLTAEPRPASVPVGRSVDGAGQILEGKDNKSAAACLASSSLARLSTWGSFSPPSPVPSPVSADQVTD
ncbi:unnamed protein product [Lampetra planeri]